MSFLLLLEKFFNESKNLKIIEESVTSTKSSPELLYTKQSADIIQLTEAGIERLSKLSYIYRFNKKL